MIADALCVAGILLVAALIITPTVFSSLGRMGWTWNGKEWEPLYWLFVQPCSDRMGTRFSIGEIDITLIAAHDDIARATGAALAALGPLKAMIAFAELRWRVYRGQIPGCVLGAGTHNGA